MYSLLPNVTTGWFIWEIFTTIVTQQTCFMCETFFVKIFQMNQPVVTCGSREYTPRGALITNICFRYSCCSLFGSKWSKYHQA